jgi:hypothetical protein
MTATAPPAPEMACLCSMRAPLTSPPAGRQTCPQCGDEMYLIGSDHDFTKGEPK